MELRECVSRLQESQTSSKTLSFTWKNTLSHFLETSLMIAPAYERNILGKNFKQNLWLISFNKKNGIRDLLLQYLTTSIFFFLQVSLLTLYTCDCHILIGQKRREFNFAGYFTSRTRVKIFVSKIIAHLGNN